MEKVTTFVEKVIFVEIEKSFRMKLNFSNMEKL